MRSAVGLEPLDQLPELAARLRVESGRGLVEKEESGSPDQRAGQGQPLPLAAGELPDP